MYAKGWIVLSLAAILSMSLAAPARGELLELGLFGSYLDSDDLGVGFGGGAKLEIAPLDLLSLDGRASLIRFDDFDIDMIPLELALRLNLPLADGHFVPYGGVGVGYYLFETDGVELDNDVGYFPMLGLEIGLRHVAFFGEARWLFLQTDVESAAEELAGINEADVDGLGVNIGLLLRF